MPTPSLTPVTPPPAKTVRMTWRRFFKRLAFGLAGLLAILLIVFLLLPQWISNDQGRTYILQQLNKRSRAQLAIADWSLGWFHPTDLHDVTLSLSDEAQGGGGGRGGRILFSSPHIHSELTLWSLLWGSYDLGTTTLESPQFNLTRYPDGSTSFDALSSPANPSTPTNRPTTLHKILNTLRGAIQFSNASLTLNSLPTHQSLSYSNVKAALHHRLPQRRPLPHPTQRHLPQAEPSPSPPPSPPLRNWALTNWPQVPRHLPTSNAPPPTSPPPPLRLALPRPPMANLPSGPTLRRPLRLQPPRPRPATHSTLTLQCHMRAMAPSTASPSPPTPPTSAPPPPSPSPRPRPPPHLISPSPSPRRSPSFPSATSNPPLRRSPVRHRPHQHLPHRPPAQFRQLVRRPTHRPLHFPRHDLPPRQPHRPTPQTLLTRPRHHRTPRHRRTRPPPRRQRRRQLRQPHHQLPPHPAHLLPRLHPLPNGTLNLLATLPTDTSSPNTPLGSTTTEVPITGPLDHPIATLPQ